MKRPTLQSLREGSPSWARIMPGPALWQSGLVDFLGRSPVWERRRTEIGLWWGNRSPRERRLLIALGGTAAIAFLILGIYRPLDETRAEAVANIRTYEVLIAQLRTAGPELSRLRSMTRGDPAAVINSTASAQGLAVIGIQSSGNLLRFSLRDADFVKLTQWLTHVEGVSDLRVSSIAVVRRPQAGLVNAQIVMKN